MLKHLVIVAVLASLASCKTGTVDPGRAYLFYDSVNEQLDMKGRFSTLLDTAQEILYAAKGVDEININTVPIRYLLDSVRILSEVKRKNLQGISEIDEQINYKAAALESLKSFKDFFDIGYEDFLDALDRNDPELFEKSKKSLLPRLLAISEKGKKFKEANEAFKAKYQRPGTSTTRENPEPVFTYKKLAELNYEMISLSEGTQIRVFSYSGGYCNEVDDMYVQFLGINQETGDTLRILTLCQWQDFTITGAPRFGTFKSYPYERYTSDRIDESFVVFNPRMLALENGNYKTVFGILEFD